MNLKIKNAKPKEYNGIKFRSLFEVEAYKTLIENGFSPLYEAERVVLFNGFKPKHCWFQDGEPVLTSKGNIPKIIDWVYSPDFKIEFLNCTVYIEIKGFPNDVYPYKRKLFLKHIDDKPAIFFEVKTKDGLFKTIERLKDGNIFIKNREE